MSFVKFPKIRKFSDALFWARRRGLQKVTFHATVKLHGANLGIGHTHVQSRNRIIPDDESFHGAREAVPGTRPPEGHVIFGELVGRGIQKGAAICQVDRAFIPFVYWDGEVFSPIAAEYGRPLTVDVWDFENIREAEKIIAKLTDQVAEQCPVASAYGVDGPGEGLVWYPVGDNDPQLWFKSKSEKFQERKAVKTKKTDPDEAKKVAFAEATVTPQRLDKALAYLEELGLPQDQTSTGDLIRWIVKDIREECQDVADELGLPMKVAVRGVGGRVAAMYRARISSVGVA